MTEILPMRRKTLSIQSINPRTRDTHTYCRDFSNEAVTICFYHLSLSRLGNTTFRLRGKRSSPLRHRLGSSGRKKTFFKIIFHSYNMNGIGQQAQVYVSPLPTKVMTDQTNVYTYFSLPKKL